MVTGFRFAYGGAQEFYGVTPDLCTLGKIIGGGFPLAAIAGREDIMSLFDRGKVGRRRFLTQIGTLSGNPVAAVAGLATLEVLRRPGAYEKVFATGRELMAGICRHAGEGRPAGAGDRRAAAVRHRLRGRRCFRLSRNAARRSRRCSGGSIVRLREGGILKGESKFYVSLAHDAADVTQTLAAVGSAVEAELAMTSVPAQ